MSFRTYLLKETNRVCLNLGHHEASFDQFRSNITVVARFSSINIVCELSIHRKLTLAFLRVESLEYAVQVRDRLFCLL